MNSPATAAFGAPVASRSWLLHPLVQLTLVRIREFTREPEAVFWACLFPVLLTTGLGIAFRSSGPEVIKIATTDAAFAESLRKSPGLSVELQSEDAARTALRVGQVALVVEPAADGSVVYRYDDTNPEGRSARGLADDALQRAAGRVDPLRSQADLVREAGSRYVDFLVPGLVGLGIMSNAVWGLGFSIVDYRRRKLIKRLLATPMPQSLYLTSYLLWRLILLPVEVVIPIVFGAVAFGVPVRGAWLSILAMALLGSLAFSAIGVLVASRARTIEGLSGIMNLVVMPMWVVSGVFFSAQRFPALLQPVIKVLPLTALIDALRAIQLQGVSLADVWPQVATLFAWLVVAFTAALKLFRWR
jgi:ABC-type polysaccharide/polyol phosphate export permease